MIRSADKYFPVFLDVRIVEGKEKGLPGDRDWETAKTSAVAFW